MMSTTTTHVEKHFTAGDTVRDIVIGLSDGLTVPFALAAGLSGAIAASRLVVTAGLAEVAAGSIAMGLGGYLAAQGDAQHYAGERLREEQEIEVIPEEERREVAELFEQYGMTAEQSRELALALSQNPKAWVDFMMRFELGMEEPDPKRAVRSALTIAGSYIAGGAIPLFPYMLQSNAHSALPLSTGITLVALAIFGWVKGRFTAMSPFRSAVQTTLIGGIAAATAFALARAIS